MSSYHHTPISTPSNINSDVATMTHKMINHRHEQIEEQRRLASLHLHLHRAAALERGAAADNESEIVGTQLAVGCGRVGVGEAGRGEDGATLHAGLETLLFEGEALEVGEGVVVSGALRIVSVMSRRR